MTRDEFHKYWLPAQFNVMCNVQRGTSITLPEGNEFEAILGTTELSDYVRRPHSEDTPMPEDLKKLLRLLSGPNFKVVLKVLELKRGTK